MTWMVMDGDIGLRQIDPWMIMVMWNMEHMVNYDFSTIHDFYDYICLILY